MGIRLHSRAGSGIAGIRARWASVFAVIGGIAIFAFPVRGRRHEHLVRIRDHDSDRERHSF
jgi:hypothetical protein